MFLGCANSANARHQARLHELDQQYKTGEIDSVQYQTKYSAEVSSHNARKMVGAMYLSGR